MERELVQKKSVCQHNLRQCSHESVSFAVPQREKHYVQLSISKSKAQSNQIGEEGENTLKKNGAEQNREHYPPPL